MLNFISKLLGRLRAELPKKKSIALERLQTEVARQTVEKDLRTKRMLDYKNQQQP